MVTQLCLLVIVDSVSAAFSDSVIETLIEEGLLGMFY